MDDVLRSAGDLAAAIRERRLTSREATEESLRRIDRWEPAINAYSDLYRDQALADASAADAALARGEQVGPLHGVPVAIKDLIDTAGMATHRGSLLIDPARATADAPIWERFRASGIVLVGKTTTPEFGWKAGSTSPRTGVTRNPWNPALTSGGSSSGSAATLAAGAVPIALGSDGGGSVRIPAAYCGVFAMKGSLGRIPAVPWSATEWLSCAGPMTRTVADSALAFDLLKGPHPDDHQSLPDDGLRYADVVREALPAGTRVAYARTLFGVAVDPEVAAAVDGAARTLAASGIPVDEVAPAWPDPFDVFAALWVGGRGTVYRDLVRGREDVADPGFARIVEAGAAVDTAALLGAMRARAEFAAHVHRLFERYDLLLLPTVPTPPFPAELDVPAWVDDPSPVAWVRWTPFTPAFNLSGNPAASLPCGLADGMPVGLQIVGRRHDDALVLQASAHLERLLEPLPEPRLAA